MGVRATTATLRPQTAARGSGTCRVSGARISHKRKTTTPSHNAPTSSCTNFAPVIQVDRATLLTTLPPSTVIGLEYSSLALGFQLGQYKPWRALGRPTMMARPGRNDCQQIAASAHATVPQEGSELANDKDCRSGMTARG